MIFRRSLVSELANSAGGVFTVLFSIVLTVGLVRILGQAAGGQIDNATVFEVVAYTSLINLPPLLALALFIAVLMTLSRSWQDSEMVVWFSSGGLSLLAWIRPVLRFALPVIVLIGALALVVSPWARSQVELNKERFAKRDDVSKVAPGRFIESEGGQRVFFVEGVDQADNQVKNVFISQFAKGVENVVVAERGVIEVMANGDRFLVLQSGRRYEGVPGQPEYRVLEFDSYAVRLDVKPDAPLEAKRASARPLAQVLSERTALNQAELQWRLSWPLAALNLVLLAIPLSFTNPRAGRSLNLVIAVLIFVLYLNGISVAQAWVQQGRIGFAAGLAMVHVPVFLVAVAFFIRRVWLLRWLPAWTSLGYWRARAGQ
ncbi:MAG: LPS export ABC transporter permease LptF [Burkholderiaceae bacterium]